MERNCPHCGKAFDVPLFAPQRATVRYCSERCRKAEENERYRIRLRLRRAGLHPPPGG